MLVGSERRAVLAQLGPGASQRDTDRAPAPALVDRRSARHQPETREARGARIVERLRYFGEQGELFTLVVSVLLELRRR